MSAQCDQEAVCGLTAFGVALFTQLASMYPSDPVVLICPLSVAGALALVTAGATPASKNEAELLGTLRVSRADKLVEASRAMLSDGKSGVSLRVANSVWTSKAILSSYVQLAQTTYDAQANPLPASFDPINKWVADKTEGMITKLLSGEPDPLTVALLVNAVFFKGSWATKFDAKLTVAGTFSAPSAELPARFMRRNAKLPGHASMPELGGAAVLRLEYGGSGDVPNDFCALLVLPQRQGPEALSDAVRGLGDLPLGQVLAALRPHQVDLWLPKFSAEWGAASLKEALRALGVAEAFDGSGGFEAMSADPEVHLSDVVHMTKLEVDEEGTVAAAATAAIMMTRAMPRPVPPLLFKVDRPFLMAVMHAPTGTPLFIGRFNEPKLTSE